MLLSQLCGEDKSVIGVLLLNLGTPDSPTIPALRRYLREFLTDPRVVDLHPLFRWLLFHLFILPFRPRRSAKAYRKIWTPEGSPLLIHSQALRQQLSEALGERFTVVLGMRYGHPSIATAIATLKNVMCQRIIVLPLFPQYSSAATGSAIESALNRIRQQWNIPYLNVRNDFFDHPGYIQSWARVIKDHLREPWPPHFIFSYHGLPQRHIDKGGCQKACYRNAACPPIDAHNRFCYRAQCYATSRNIALENKIFGGIPISFRAI